MRSQRPLIHVRIVDTKGIHQPGELDVEESVIRARIVEILFLRDDSEAFPIEYGVDPALVEQDVGELQSHNGVTIIITFPNHYLVEQKRRYNYHWVTPSRHFHLRR